MRDVSPTDRMGVYKRLAQVPEERRLGQFESAYHDYDVWDEFLTDHLFERFDSERFVEKVRRTGRQWKTHMNSRGRHHALADPRDVETWSKRLLSEYKIRTAYNSYWVQIERFYTWLLWNREHPHVYHPVWMAAERMDASRQIWAEKIGRGHGGDRS